MKRRRSRPFRVAAKRSATAEFSCLQPERTENQPVSLECFCSQRAKQKSVSIEAAMANAKCERARARARLALIAPALDEVTAAYFDGQVEKVLPEAKQREEKSDQELIATLLDAVARKYFSLSVRDRDPERSPVDRPPGPIPTKS
jgi:excinuclease UvrABC helicase subunit UvrB